MESPFSPRQRAERLIAGGRVVLAATSLAALWRDPSEPAKYAAIAYALLVAYLFYALILSAVAWRAAAARPGQGLFAHCFDLIFFSAFMYFTSGPASPFIAYFVFSLVCATLRWQWRGTLWTAIASLACFFGLGFYFSEVLDDPTFELNEFLIRGVYMGVVAFLLGHLGRHEQRTRQEIALLADWPSRPSGTTTERLLPLLEHVAKIHGAPRVGLAWSPTGGGRPTLALLAGGVLTRSPLDSPADDSIAPDLRGASFLAPGGTGRPREVLVHRDGALNRWHGRPVTDPLALQFGTGGLLSVPWRAELASGRLFVGGLAEATSDDLLLAEVVGALAGAQIDGHLLIERMRESAAAEERVRLARDLHDGVLQSLTGVALRIAAARRLVDDSSTEAKRNLDELQRLLAVEQRDLRFFIQDLEPPAEGQPDFDLAQRLAELVHRVEQEWQLDVSLAAEPLDEELPESAERDVYFIVREALFNAVRHGAARRISIRVTRPAPSRLAILIEDDGCGFPSHGRFDAAQLAATGAGPRSLRERVTARGGTLFLDTDERGSRLDLEVPV